MTVVVPFDPNYPRCAATGCDRIITAGSPSEYWCSPKCQLAWFGANDDPFLLRGDEFSAPEMKCQRETTQRSEGLDALDFALPWMHIKARGAL